MRSNRFSVSAKIFSAPNFQKIVLPKIVFLKNKPGEKTLEFPNKVTRKNVTPIVKVKTLQEKMKMFFNSNGTLTSIHIFYERHLQIEKVLIGRKRKNWWNLVKLLNLKATYFNINTLF